MGTEALLENAWPCKLDTKALIIKQQDTLIRKLFIHSCLMELETER